jgi:hypothetical protein
VSEIFAVTGCHFDEQARRKHIRQGNEILMTNRSCGQPDKLSLFYRLQDIGPTRSTRTLSVIWGLIPFGEPVFTASRLVFERW